VNAIAVDRYLVKRTRTGNKDFEILRMVYPLSESVTPDGNGGRGRLAGRVQ
jgi:hypothetical protein